VSTSLPRGAKRWRYGPLTSSGASPAGTVDFKFCGGTFHPGPNNHWKVRPGGLEKLEKAGLLLARRNSIAYYLFAENYPVQPITTVWDDTKWGFDASEKLYVVQTNVKVVEKCVLMTTDPGDLVLDPTCGSGTTAFVAEQWGRRWITIDTSRIALALARARIVGARYPYYLLADSADGQKKEGEVSRTPPKQTPTHNDIRHGFVYERVPHITLKSIANNAEIDVIWEKWQQTLEPLRARLNALLGLVPSSFETAAPRLPQDEGESFSPHLEEARRAVSKGEAKAWEEWEIPRETGADWPDETTRLHSDWWQARIERQREIDGSIAAKAEFKYLYDKSYPDNSRIRVAGPFTVESLSPHRFVPGDQDDSLIHELAESEAGWEDFGQTVLENLKTAGVQQAHKEDRISFTALTPWPGKLISAEGRYSDGHPSTSSGERRAAILVGSEFGTVSRPDLVNAAREAADAGFDLVIACAFNFDARSAELDRIGRIPILKARMSPDLHMAGELKSTGAGNLFVVFGEPDIEIEPIGADQIRVKVKGVDVFKAQTGEIEAGGPETIALWFIDTDYNEESFFVRHAYFLGATADPQQGAEDDTKGRDRRIGLGEPPEQHFAPLPKTQIRPHRRQGHQPSRR
jgi:adenine-specific DNA-methyltransferase